MEGLGDPVDRIPASVKASLTDVEM